MGSKKGNVYLVGAYNVIKNRNYILGIYPTLEQGVVRLESLLDTERQDWLDPAIHVILTPEDGTDLEIAL